MESGLFGQGAIAGESVPRIQGVGISHTVASAAERGRSPSFVAVLAGMGLGWVIGAVLTLLKPVFLIGQPTEPLVLAGCLLALSVGPSLPQRMVWVLTRLARSQRLGSPPPSGPSPASLKANSPRDVQLLWVILATVSTLAGLAAAAFPLLCVAGRSVYGSAMEHFFWMPLPHGILIVLLTLTVTVLPLSLIACGLTCVSQLTRSDGLWSQAALPWILLGAGTGLAVSSGLVHSVLPLNASIALAALPLFAVAIVAVGQSKTAADASLASVVAPQEIPVFAATPTRPRKTAIVIAAIQTMAVVVWIHLLSTVEQFRLSAQSLTTLALWTTAAGIAMASRRSSRMSGTAVGRRLGSICVFAGACHVIAAAVVTGRLDPLVHDALTANSILLISSTAPWVALFTGGWTIGLIHQVALAPMRDGPNYLVGHNAMGAAILGRCATWPAIALMVMAAADRVGTEPGSLLTIAGLAVVGGGIALAWRPPSA